MSVDFSKLDMILTVVESIEKHVTAQTHKRWLNTQEVAKYLGDYSVDSIRNFVKNGEFIKGEHYYKKRKKILYDSHALDKWVISDSNKEENKINAIIQEIKEHVA